MASLKFDIIINEEKLSRGRTIFVAHCNSLNVTSQGESIEKVRNNIKEAICIELEECPEKVENISERFSEPLFTTLEVDNEITRAIGAEAR